MYNVFKFINEKIVLYQLSKVYLHKKNDSKLGVFQFKKLSDIDLDFDQLKEIYIETRLYFNSLRFFVVDNLFEKANTFQQLLFISNCSELSDDETEDIHLRMYKIAIDFFEYFCVYEICEVDEIRTNCITKMFNDNDDVFKWHRIYLIKHKLPTDYDSFFDDLLKIDLSLESLCVIYFASRPDNYEGDAFNEAIFEKIVTKIQTIDYCNFVFDNNFHISLSELVIAKVVEERLNLRKLCNDYNSNLSKYEHSKKIQFSDLFNHHLKVAISNKPNSACRKHAISVMFESKLNRYQWFGLLTLCVKAE